MSASIRHLFQTAAVVIFDVDGVILNSFRGAGDVFGRAIVSYGVTMSDYQIRNIWRQGWGRPALQFIKELLPDIKRPEEFLAHWREVDKNFSHEVFPGVYDLLRHLADRGKTLALCSSRNQESVFHHLAAADLWKYFHIQSFPQGEIGKPHPMMLQKILDQRGWSADQFVMLGDSVAHDWVMCRQLNVPFVAVLGGSDTTQDFINAGLSVLQIVTSPAALLGIIA